MKHKKVLPWSMNFDNNSFREVVAAKGISVTTLRRQIKERKEAELVRQAENALRPHSAGWNPRAGNRKGMR